MKNKNQKWAWNFIRSDLDGNPILDDFKGPTGDYRSSSNIIEALMSVPDAHGLRVCLSRVSGVVSEFGDFVAYTKLGVIFCIPADPILRVISRRIVLSSLFLWKNAPKVVGDFLETGDRSNIEKVGQIRRRRTDKFGYIKFAVGYASRDDEYCTARRSVLGALACIGRAHGMKNPFLDAIKIDDNDFLLEQMIIDAAGG
jgi:hypothetical protein